MNAYECLLSDIYAYSGPIVVMDECIGAYVGEWNSPSGYCLICGGVFAKVSQHIYNTHKDHKVVQDIVNGSKSTAGEAMEHVLREGNHFKNNAAALATETGLFLPIRRTLFFRSFARMVVCKYCHAGVDKSHLSRHYDGCVLARSAEKVIDEASKYLLTDKTKT